MSTNTASIEQIIQVALLTPLGDPRSLSCVWGLPILFWGSPGIGKSDRVYAAAASAGLACLPILPATCQPEDFSGVPVPDGNGGVHLACIFGAVNELVAKKEGVLFCDEISCARPAVQAAFMGLVLNRRIGDTVLPPGVRLLSAANPPEEAAGGWDLEPPLANRFAHFNFRVPTADEWVQWLLSEGGAGVRPLDEKLVAKEWGNTWPRVKGLMAGFMKAKPSALYKLPEVGDAARGRAWPSPRSWVFAARSVATAMALGLHKDRDGKDTSLPQDMVEGCVGTGAAAEWGTWVADADLPDPADMLAHGWPIDKRRLDRVVAAYSGMTAHITSRSTKEEQVLLANRGWELLSDLFDAGLGDLTVTPAQTLVRRNLNTVVCPNARGLLLKLGKSSLGRFIEEEK